MSFNKKEIAEKTKNENPSDEEFAQIMDEIKRDEATENAKANVYNKTVPQEDNLMENENRINLKLPKNSYRDGNKTASSSEAQEEKEFTKINNVEDYLDSNNSKSTKRLKFKQSEKKQYQPKEKTEQDNEQASDQAQEQKQNINNYSETKDGINEDFENVKKPEILSEQKVVYEYKERYLHYI